MVIKREVMKIYLNKGAAFINSTYFFIDDVSGRDENSEYCILLEEMKGLIKSLAHHFRIGLDDEAYINVFELQDKISIYFYSDSKKDRNTIDKTTNHLVYTMERDWLRSDYPSVLIEKADNLIFYKNYSVEKLESTLKLLYNFVKEKYIPYAKKSLENK